MNKALPTIAALLLVVLSATGCDFFRRLAGRPVSSEIKAKAEAIGQEEALKEQANRDSLDKVARHFADSLAAVDSLKGEKLIQPEALGGVKADSLLRKYYIIVGSFSKEANASKFASSSVLKDYAPVTISFSNGYTAVGICGTDDIIEIHRSLTEVRRQDFCPKGVWILDNEK